MPVGRDYTTLVTSLPHLPYFESAERLSLTEQALRQRLNMLLEDDAAQLQLAINLLRWRRHPVSVPTENIEAQYRTAMNNITNDGVRDYVDWHVGMRAVMAALRMKARGHKSPPEKLWGAGRLVRMIQSNWSDSDVGAKSLYPWIGEARRHLESGDAMALERLEMAAVWRRVTALAEMNPFGFEAVAAYSFKWDILHRWLSYNPQRAKQRFEELVLEVIGEHQLVCN